MWVATPHYSYDCSDSQIERTSCNHCATRSTLLSDLLILYAWTCNSRLLRDDHVSGYCNIEFGVSFQHVPWTTTNRVTAIPVVWNVLRTVNLHQVRANADADPCFSRRAMSPLPWTVPVHLLCQGIVILKDISQYIHLCALFQLDYNCSRLELLRILPKYEISLTF